MRAFVPGGRSRGDADLLLLGEFILNADAFNDGIADGPAPRERIAHGPALFTNRNNAAARDIRAGLDFLARTADDSDRRNGHNKDQVHSAPFSSG